MEQVNLERQARTFSGSRRFWLTPKVQNNIAGYLFMAPWLIHLSVLIVGAMFFSLGISFYDTDFLTKAEFVGFGNYRQMLSDPLFWKSLRNTAYYAFAMVPLSIVFALGIALLLNQKVKFVGVYRTLYYIPSVISGVAVALLWSYLLNPRFGLINRWLAVLGIPGPEWIYSQAWAIPAFVLMGVWGAGGSMLLYLAGLQGVPTALYEAAKIDGANGWHRFWRITLPMLTPTIYFNLLINLIGAWQVFTQSYVMTSGGPNNATLTMVLYLYRKGFEQFHFGYAAAIAWAIFVIVMIFTALVVRSSAAWVFYEGELKR